MKASATAMVLAGLLLTGAGCLGGGQSRSGSAQAQAWYEERAGDLATERDERLRRLEEATDRLDSHFRRMHADLGGQLDVLRADLDVLIAKIDAQDRWLSQLQDLVRRAEAAGLGGGAVLPGQGGLPQADGRVARFDGSGRPAQDPGAVWDEPAGRGPARYAGTPGGEVPPASQGMPPATGEQPQMPLLPAEERARRAGDSGAAGPGGEGSPGGADTTTAADPSGGEGAAGQAGQTEQAEQAGQAEQAERGAGAPESMEEARRLYEVAYQDLMRENYQLALINFRSFLERHPATVLSDNAQYWIGEVYYAQGQFHLAVEEFRKVVEDYPGHEKVPAAYLKIALCFQKLQDLPTARRYLEYVIQNYPETREAQLAEERLEQF